MASIGRVLAWIEHATWPSVIAALTALTPSEVTLIATLDEAQFAMAETGHRLFGRAGHPHLTAALTPAQQLLDRAAEQWGRPCRTEVLTGRPERAVVEALARADLLVLARDGDRSALGPHSLRRHTRFVVDHAPCQVLLVWPEPAPGVGHDPATTLS